MQSKEYSMSLRALFRIQSVGTYLKLNTEEMHNLESSGAKLAEAEGTNESEKCFPTKQPSL